MQPFSVPFGFGMRLLDDVEVKSVGARHGLQSTIGDDYILDDGIDFTMPMIEKPVYPRIAWPLIECLPDELIDQSVMTRNVIEHLDGHEALWVQQ